MAALLGDSSKSPTDDRVTFPTDDDVSNNLSVEINKDKIDKNEEDTFKESAHQLTQATLEAAAKRLETIEKNKHDPSVKDIRSKHEHIILEEHNPTSLKEHIGVVEDPLEKATRFLEKHQLLMLFQVWFITFL